MQNSDQMRLHATVEGRVQGVGFRFYVLERALSMDITGWVRNTSVGEVEVMAEGNRKSLERLVEALRTGPRSAFVTHLQLDWQTFSGEFNQFDVRGTVD